MKKLILFLLLFTSSIHAADLAQGVAREITVYFEDPATGLGKTGITVTSETCRYVKNDMTSASFSPTASGGSNDQVEIGHGYYKQEITAAQLDTIGNWDFHCQISGSASPATLYQVLAASSPVFSGSYATTSSIWEYPKASIIDANGIGFWLKTNADVPISQHATTSLGVRTTIATRASQTSFTLTDGAPDNSAYPAGSLVVIRDQSTVDQIAYGTISAYTGSTKTVTLAADPGFTHATGDFVTIIPDRALKPTTPGATLDTTGAIFATTFFGTVIEGTHTLKQSIQYLNSAMVGKYSASGSTFNFRDLGDTKNRIIYTTTATSRATVTLSPD
jgi:hypothetical protein